MIRGRSFAFDVPRWPVGAHPQESGSAFPVHPAGAVFDLASAHGLGGRVRGLQLGYPVRVGAGYDAAVVEVVEEGIEGVVQGPALYFRVQGVDVQRVLPHEVLYFVVHVVPRVAVQVLEFVERW